MTKTHEISKWGGKLGSAIGRGIIAGLAGTAAITITQYLERKMTGKPVNFAPGDAAAKALGIEASGREEWPKFSNEVHWTYGTLWGVGRGLLALSGLKGLPASAVHFAAIYYTALHVEPDFEVAAPLKEWSKKEITVFALHHVAYVIAAGLVFDAINKEDH